MNRQRRIAQYRATLAAGVDVSCTPPTQYGWRFKDYVKCRDPRGGIVQFPVLEFDRSNLDKDYSRAPIAEDTE